MRPRRIPSAAGRLFGLRFTEGVSSTYTGKLDSAVFLAGNGRLLFHGELSSDPKVSRIGLYWNVGTRQDSLSIDVDYATDKIIEREIAIGEGSYNFQIYTYDGSGNHSIPMTRSGNSYGANYLEGLYNRVVKTCALDGKDIAPYTEKQMRKLRGSLFSMLFQDPMTTLNPTIPIGKQITEAVLKHRKMSREDTQKLAVEMLHRVGIDDPAQRMLLQPHYFSGGMRQRCVLAIALALNPHILFADEPTTALDVTVQAQMLDLLRDIQRKTGIGIVLVSHDLGVVARIADRVAVMYAGKIVEIGTAEEIFYDPRHPYTWGLLGALPSQAVENGELRGIPGMPPTLLDPPPGDAFAERNQYAMKIDYERMPPMFPVSETHSAATWLLDERAPAVTPPVTIKRRGMVH